MLTERKVQHADNLQHANASVIMNFIFKQGSRLKFFIDWIITYVRQMLSRPHVGEHFSLSDITDGQQHTAFKTLQQQTNSVV